MGGIGWLGRELSRERIADGVAWRILSVSSHLAMSMKLIKNISRF